MDKKLGDTQYHYTPDPGTVEGPVQCGVCGTEMTVHRNCYGPTSSIMAMAGSKRYYDSFSCPLSEEAWHKQVIRLREAKYKTPSATIADILEKEIQQVLDTRTPTR